MNYKLFLLVSRAGCLAFVLVNCQVLLAQSGPAPVKEQLVSGIENLATNFNYQSKPSFNNTQRPRGIYLGIGAGFSFLEPSLKGVTGRTLEDDDSVGGQVMFGIDVSSRVSVEAHSAYLGEAEFGPSGSLRYRVHGLSGLYYFSRAGWKLGKTRLNGFFRAGARYIDFSERGGVNVRGENRANLLLGAGLELNTRSPISARLDAISFSEDARFLQASLLYRFGRRAGSSTSLAVQPTITVINILNVGSAPSNPPTLDAAKDEERVLEVPASFGQDVNFRNDSHTLTLNAKRLLDDVVGDLKQNPHERVKVIAHTDSRGSESYNQRLAERRSRSVVNYLTSRGITGDRMETTNVGESEPIAPNSDSTGRARNRRVEIFTPDR